MTCHPSVFHLSIHRHRPSGPPSALRHLIWLSLHHGLRLCVVYLSVCVFACVCVGVSAVYGWHKQFFCCDITFIWQSHFRVAQPLYFLPHATSFSLKSAETCRETSADLVRSKTTTLKRKNVFRVYSCPLVATDSLTHFKTSITGFIWTKYENDNEGRYHFYGYTAYLQRHYWSQQPLDDFPQFEPPHGAPAKNTWTNRNQWHPGDFIWIDALVVKGLAVRLTHCGFWFVDFITETGCIWRWSWSWRTSIGSLTGSQVVDQQGNQRGNK